MSKYRGPQMPVAPTPAKETVPVIPPAPLGFLPNRPKRFLCFECLGHPPFLSREELKAHMEHGHRD